MGSVRIDANGNILAPLSSESQGRAPCAASQSGTGGGRFQTLTDLPPPATAGRPPSPWEQIQANFTFRWRSVLGVLVALQILTFFVSCWLVTPRGLITPSPPALWKLGSSNSVMERCVVVSGGKFVFELRRFVVAIFLHNGVLHILFNLAFQVMSGPKALETYGPKAFLCLFVVSGICGNLLSDAFGNNGVGASTACYGLIGAFLAQICLLWPSMDANQKWLTKMMLGVNGAFLIVWELAQWKHLDHLGHLGGLLSGVALGFALAGDAPVLWRRLSTGLLVAAISACAVKIFIVGSTDVTPATCDAEWLLYSS
mmetsp:Transcript_101059/g.284919  ORF Transcript_101059/g.284919 Transcript_101059/m.284919 type:complete len:313 (-) Transcript_101059:116-1054(-)